MSGTSSKGGKFKGNSHANGGIPLVVKETGQQIEVEGEEALIPVEVSEDSKTYELEGTNAQILDKVLDKVGAKGMDEKATEVHAGDMITCVRSTNDKTKHKYKGSLKQIVSKVNESGGCNPIHEGGEQVFDEGGTVTPEKDISKMTQKELYSFMLKLDPIKAEKINWFKGSTVKGLRVQVQSIYDKRQKEKLLKGGKISSKNKDGFIYANIDDSLYTWQYNNNVALYSLYAGEDACDLDCLINHSKLFKKYKGIGKIKVRFFNGKENKAEVILPETANVSKHFDECKINITLNFEYYEETNKEFRTIDSDEPDLAKESILLHEIQHVLQAVHNRPSGTSRTQASVQANARVDALRNLKKSSNISEKENEELDFYNGLKKEQLHDFFYYNDIGEKEARKTVREWLKNKGIRCIDPLTEEFGIPIEDDEKLREGGATKKSALDRILEEAEPFIDSVHKKRIESIEKENAEKGRRPLREIDKQLIRLDLIYDLIKAVGNYVDKTDVISDLKASTDKGVITISATVNRDSKEYYFSTRMIIAGGHNIQVMHYRYIVNTNLLKTSSNPDADRVKKEIKKLNKKEKIQFELDRFEKIYSERFAKREENLKLSDDEIFERLTEDQKRILNTKYADLSEFAMDNYNNSESEFAISQKDYHDSCIRSWKSINIPDLNGLDLIKKSINKYKKQISEIDTFKEGGEADDFDYTSLFDDTHEPLENTSLTREQEIEEAYQKSTFDKKWASSFVEAKSKLIQQYKNAKESYDDWSSRVYKSNKTVINIGEELGGTSKSIGSINEIRRNHNLDGFKMQMDEAIADLKSIGLTQDEINSELELLKNKFLFGGTTDGNYELFDKALEYEGLKISNERIFYETGHFKGLDGKWRTEIDDSSYLFKFDANRLLSYYESKKTIILSSLINHEEFFRIFPQAKRIPIYLDDISNHEKIRNRKRNDISAIGEFRYRTDLSTKFNFYSIVLYLDFKYIKEHGKEENDYPSESTAGLIVLHELQHIFQGQRGFRKGSTASERMERIYGRIEEIRNDLSQNEGLDVNSPEAISIENKFNYFFNNIEDLSDEEYYNDPAEVEAREVVNRFIDKNKSFPKALDGTNKFDEGGSVQNPNTIKVMAHHEEWVIGGADGEVEIPLTAWNKYKKTGRLDADLERELQDQMSSISEGEYAEYKQFYLYDKSKPNKIYAEGGLVLRNLKDALGNLTPEQKTQKIVVINKGAFIGDPITFYKNGSLYKGNTKYVREIIKSRGSEKPSTQEISEAKERLKERLGVSYDNTFNVVLTTNFGNWVIQADLVEKPKKTSLEDVQMALDIIDEVNYEYQNKREAETALASITTSELRAYTKDDLKLLISQLETAMSDVLKSGDIEKSKKLNELIGNAIDIYNSFPETSSAKKSKTDWLEYKSTFYDDGRTYIMQNADKYPDDANYDKLFEVSKHLVDSGREPKQNVANEWAEQFVIHHYYDPTFEGLRRTLESDKEFGTKIANDWIEFGYELPSDILVILGLYKPSNFRPIFWQMTMDEFCEYAENYEVDTRLDGTKAKMECKDFYKYSIILPMLHESAERNVFLLAVETDQLPYSKAVEIIKSANGWDENNRFVKQLLEYNHIRNFNANIWKLPKDIYLSSDYFKNNFTKSQADKWYAKQIYKDAILNDKELHSFLEKGIVKFKDVQERLKEGNVNITKADQRFVDKLEVIANRFKLKLKLKGLRLILDDTIDVNNHIPRLEKMVDNESNIIVNRIKQILDDGKVYAPDNRCWWTVYLVWKKLATKEKEHVLFVEGKMDGGSHYWLEVDGKIVDPHYYIIDDLSDIEVGSPELYVPIRKLKLEDAIIDLESHDERFCQNKKGKSKWTKVGSIDFPSNTLPKNQQDFVNQLIKDTQSGVKYNKTKLEKVARDFGVMEQNLAKELAELSIVKVSRAWAHEEGLSDKQRYDKLVDIYKEQVNLSHRSSQSVLLQQYSTPVYIGYLMGLFTQKSNEALKSVPTGQPLMIDTCAGNGALTISFDSKDCIVNEVDETRLKNLESQGFKKVLKQDAEMPFEEYKNSIPCVVVNPPFGKTDPVKFSGIEIGSLEQLMALRALEVMSHNGRSAIITGGHQIYDKQGRVQAGKNRLFSVYLYKHFEVLDVINISGRDLYSRQGTAFNTRIFLVGGRKETPSGFPPLIDKPIPINETNSYTPVNSFEVLWERISRHF